MLGIVELLVHWLASLVKSRRRLHPENLVLRHQVNIVRRRASRRMRLSSADRLAFVWFYRLCPTALDAVTVPAGILTILAAEVALQRWLPGDPEEIRARGVCSRSVLKLLNGRTAIDGLSGSGSAMRSTDAGSNSGPQGCQQTSPPTASGLMDRARAYREELARTRPVLALGQVGINETFKDAADLEPLLEGLRKAGLPE